MERIVFMGTPRFGQMVLSALIGQYEMAAVVTQPDRKAGRGQRLAISAVKSLALERQLPLLQPQKLRQPEVVQELARLAPEVIVVAAFGQILPASILSLPRHGCVNVHASLLPRHRGAAPIPAAILAGDKQTGVTIMLMDQGVDTGSILSQESIDITADDTSASLEEKLGAIGGRLLLNTLPGWLRGQVTPRAQDPQLATYAGLLKREDGHIVWDDPAEKIAQQCRAFYPWPGAFALWEEKELKILRAQPAPGSGPEEPPGTVVQSDSGPGVVTGNGLLVLELVQLAGKRPLPAVEFVHGQRHFLGSILH